MSSWTHIAFIALVGIGALIAVWLFWPSFKQHQVDSSESEEEREKPTGLVPNHPPVET